jgi:glycogen operon protein
MAPGMACRLAGSSDLMPERGPLANVNYVATHDGMTLEDVVCFAARHNEANGEGNADGASNDFSWNHGVEGRTNDKQIQRRREQDKRNLIATLLLSPGVPMIAAGDEFGHSQNGNNNAYCQDNEISWLDWGLGHGASGARFLAFVQRLIALRKSLDIVRPTSFFTGDGQRGVKDIAWLRPDGREFADEDWQKPELRAFACTYALHGSAAVQRYALMLNPEDHDVAFAVPCARWCVLLDTSDEPPTAETKRDDGQWRVRAHSLTFLSDGPGA